MLRNSARGDVRRSRSRRCVFGGGALRRAVLSVRSVRDISGVHLHLRDKRGHLAEPADDSRDSGERGGGADIRPHPAFEARKLRDSFSPAQEYAPSGERSELCRRLGDAESALEGVGQCIERVGKKIDSARPDEPEIITARVKQSVCAACGKCAGKNEKLRERTFFGRREDTPRRKSHNISRTRHGILHRVPESFSGRREFQPRFCKQRCVGVRGTED